MTIELPDYSLVLLIGASGCGKSTFAAKHFLPTEVISSDECRGLVSDDENSLDATGDAFELLRFLLRIRLSRRRLTVIDATNVQPEARKELIKIAREYHALTYGIIFNFPEEICAERNKSRPDRQFGPHVIRNQMRSLRSSFRNFRREGMRAWYEFKRPEEIEAIEFVRTPLWPDKRDEHGPFDVIGDIHGCFDELTELLDSLGYKIEGSVAAHPAGRKLVFLGDLTDRGPNSPGVLRLVMSTVAAGHAYCVPGNHDKKLVKKLMGRDVTLAHGLEETMRQLGSESEELRQEVCRFLDSLVSHYVLDDGKLVVAHAGMKEEMQNRASAAIREFAMYGETTGETDEFGLPVRWNWAADYRGSARVVYGHTPVPEPEWLNRTINIDTGCVFGGKLTALRYPELELVSVPAHATYAEPRKPFLTRAAPLSAQHQLDDLLDLEDVWGKRIIHTRLGRNITLREENASAALESMSRFAANPKWLVYLPPTMSPSETSQLEGYLEHPTEAFQYFRNQGVPKVICEEKHMGSRAVVVLCKSQEAAAKRFGITSGERGIIYTRTGRRFFDDLVLEEALLDRVTKAIEGAGIWDELATEWVVLDCELMPWSAKAQQLLSSQYAPLATAGQGALASAVHLLERAGPAIDGIPGLLCRVKEKHCLIERYADAYLRYCWPVNSIEDYRLAPFHILATEGAVHIEKDHLWHMEVIGRIATQDAILIHTPHKIVDVQDRDSEEEAVRWWLDLTGKGGEGMVVKPIDFVFTGPKGLVQPALKCRGQEYLRIIYGPEYTLPENLERLRSRGLGRKRSLATREFALGIEALERFVAKEPLRRVHECVFAVLALESEPVDPRL